MTGWKGSDCFASLALVLQAQALAMTIQLNYFASSPFVGGTTVLLLIRMLA
jgi:hypothetical protein